MKRLIFGCGYLGTRVAALWHGQGDEVHVVTRSAERAEEFSRAGWLPHVADLTRPDSLPDFLACDTILFAVGYDRSSEVPIEEVYASGVANVLVRPPEDVGQLIYISSTGVYGPAEGDWVDETSPLNPQRAGGRACVLAERTLANHPLGKRSLVLRLAGIYGPGRVPSLDKLRGGEPLEVPSEGWLNLIHVEDAAAIVDRVDEYSRSQVGIPGPQFFNVSDGNPVQRGEYYAEVARLLGLDEPKFSTPPEESPAAARARSNKRISNQKLMEAIRPNLSYPDYRAGLASILTGE